MSDTGREFSFCRRDYETFPIHIAFDRLFEDRRELFGRHHM